MAYLARGWLQAVTPAASVPGLGSLTDGQGSLLEHVEGWLRREAAETARLRAAAGQEEPVKAFEYLWNNGWKAGRLTSSLAGSSNTVARM